MKGVFINSNMLKNRISNELDDLKNKKNFRILTPLNNKLINFSSNDYMGIGNDINLHNEFYKKYTPLLSSTSSRLISGSYPEVIELENKLEQIYKNSALVFNSGFDCNSCIIETFFKKNCLILTDRLNHASIYEGILHTESKFIRYPHLNLDKLEKLLIENQSKYEYILVVSETIYSMDGDCVDLKKLVELKKRYDFYLMIDEAHSFNVHGYGLAYNYNLIKDIDFLTIPLGKGGGSVGCYLITDELFKQYIINKGKKFIYSTALPPVNNAWNLFILDKIPSFNEKRTQLEKLTQLSHFLIKEYDLVSFSNSHIISIIIGDNSKLDKITNYLNKMGFFVYGVKEPTVPKGSSRIRVGLTPEMSLEQLNKFFKELHYAINNIF